MDKKWNNKNKKIVMHLRCIEVDVHSREYHTDNLYVMILAQHVTDGTNL